nr:IucA/IucC family protein [uncultured Halomonas sp.]
MPNPDYPPSQYDGSSDLGPNDNDIAAACFFNALLRETSTWRREIHGNAQVAVLPLSESELHLRLRHISASGEARFIWPILQADGKRQDRKRPIAFEEALTGILATPSLVGHLDARQREIFRECVLESHRNTRASLSTRDDLPHLQQGPLTFAEAEQGLLAGHAFHPAPKSRSPFTAHEAMGYCPEHRACFALAWWAVAPKIQIGDSSRSQSAAELTRELLPEVLAERLPAGFAVLPMHPWQAQQLRQSPRTRTLEAQGQLLWLGEASADWIPTSSHRSLYAPGAPWMLKGSLSAKLTNSLRLLSEKEVARGVRLDAWMRDLDVSRRFHGFAVMQEPAWLGWRNTQGGADPASLVVLRENPLRDTPDAEAVVLATLTQQPFTTKGTSLLGARIGARAEQSGQSSANVARAWFAAFCERVLTPLFGLVVEDGIVLLAHQQNIVLRLEAGWPTGMFYRDCQGSGVSDHFLERHPELALAPPENHWAQTTVRRYFLYYLLINSTFAVTSALAADGLIDEAVLLADLRSHLHGLLQHLEGDHDCLHHALEAPTLDAKGNFFCYLSGVNEATLAEPARLYLPLANPLADPHVRSLTAQRSMLSDVSMPQGVFSCP